MRALSILKCGLLLGTTLGAAVPALAQDTPPPAETATAQAEEGQIIVTARRTEELLQDVPISITAFSQEQLTDRNVTNAQDLANYTPSLSANSNFGSDNSSFAIRGFVQDIGTGPSVGVYFADVVAPRGPSIGFPGGDGAGPGSFFDLQNVQVLKGPQGTLFGRNTTGGAVLLVPQKPTGEFEGYVEGSIGNYDMRRLQGVMNVPIGNDVRLRVGGDWQKRDGYLRNLSGIGPNRFNDVDYIALRASLVVDLAPTLENYTVASFTRSDTNGSVQRIIGCNNTPNPANFLGLAACANLAQLNAGGFYTVMSDVDPAYTKTRQWQVINTTTWEASDSLTVKNIISYAQLRSQIRSALFGSNFQLGPGLNVGFASIRHLPGGYSANQSTFTEELQIQGRTGAFDWQAGLYYEDSKPRGFIGSQSPVFLVCADSDNFQCIDLSGQGTLNYTAAKQSFRSTALYAQGTYTITDQIKATVGARYTWDRTGSISRQISYIYPVFPAVGAPTPFCTRFLITTLPNCELQLTAKFDKPTWHADINYKPSDDVMLYLSYTRGYRAGGIKSDVPIEYAIFQPEKVDTYEIGAKTSFGGPVRGNFNIAAFYNNFRNQQLQAGFFQNPASPIGVTPTAGPVNAGKSRIWGIEADMHLRLFEGFTLDGAYTYLNTRIKAITPITLPPTSPYIAAPQAVVGDRLALSPKHQLSVTGTYVLPIDDSVGKISLGATYNYTSSQISTYSDRIPQVTAFTGGVDLGTLAPRNLVNLNINWDSVGGSPVDLSLFATNVTKEKYYAYVPGIIAGTGFETAVIGEPRMYGARIRVRY